MRLRTILVTTTILLTAAGLADAQQRRMHGGFSEPEFELKSEDGTVVIPFQAINNHLLIPLSIGGSTFNVILDTGMPISSVMLYENDKVRNLDLNYGSMDIRVAGAGGGEPISARLAQGATVDIASARMTGATLLVMPPMHRLSNYHEGVIGAALFDRFVVAIDYDTREVRLHDPERYEPSPEAVAVPLNFGGHRRVPYADLKVKTADRSLDLQVVVDLGASHAISLNTESTDSLDVPVGAIPTIIGRGVGGQVRGQVGRIAGLELGGFDFAGVVATFPIDEHQHPGGMDSKNGNLGSGILKRFNVTFDYANERMLLEPNGGFEAPFEWDMSGLRLDPAEAGLRVEELIANSPAAEAGLRVDDVVTHVNGEPATADNLIEVLDLMKRDGAEIGITAVRGGEPVEVRFTLRRLV